MLNPKLKRMVRAWRSLMHEEQQYGSRHCYSAHTVSKGLQEVSRWIDDNCDATLPLTDNQLALIRQMAKMAIDRARYKDTDH